jgi:hypothetical protein
MPSEENPGCINEKRRQSIKKMFDLGSFVESDCCKRIQETRNFIEIGTTSPPPSPSAGIAKTAFPRS